MKPRGTNGLPFLPLFSGGQVQFDVRTRVFGAYLVVLVLGAILASFVYFAGDDVRSTLRTLVERDVPELRAISALKLNITRHEALLNEYLATRDRARFLTQYQSVDTVCAQGLESIAGTLAGAAAIERSRPHYEAIRRAALALDAAMQVGQAPRARLELARAAAAASAIRLELDALASEIETRAAASGTATETTVDTVQRWVVLLAAAIFVVSLFIGVYINAYIAEQAERRRLALFPQRDPNPVLELDADGVVHYANPAAVASLEEIGLEGGDPRALLPPNIEERLAALKRSHAPRAAWEYTVDSHVFECHAHWIADLGVFHVHLRDITARKRAEEHIVYQAYHDALTGLPNRRMFQERIEPIIHGPHRDGMRAAVLLLGLDRFKTIIDSLGHTTGDELLKAVATRLGETLAHGSESAGDTQLYRFEGDLFGMLIPGFRTAETPALLAERILESLRAPFYVEGRELHTAASIGIAVFPLDGQDGVTLLKNADTAMYRAKRQGGNTLQYYLRDMNDRAAELLALENHLRHAEELGELRLHYHPQVNIMDGSLSGVEALLRWQHPERGLLPPGLFVPLAEETGLIAPLGAWTLRAACAQAKDWLEQGLGPVTVAVNISAHQFHQQDLPALVRAVLHDTALPAPHLELEITEGVAMQDVERTIVTLRALRDIGVKLSLDDFGTGFSSLAYLKRFPIDKLKLDQSFVRNLTTDENDAAIVRAVIALGHSLKLRVIAEGVETADQLMLLRKWKCDEYQGSLYSPPLPAGRLVERMRGANLSTVGAVT
jgi:diguanylate cyclase (GGDEF)-like protein